MTVKDLLMKELSDAFPDKKFDTLIRIEENTLKPYAMITVNGKATGYGYYPELVGDMVSQNLMTEAQWVTNFLQFNGPYFRGL